MDETYVYSIAMPAAVNYEHSKFSQREEIEFYCLNSQLIVKYLTSQTQLILIY